MNSPSFAASLPCPALIAAVPLPAFDLSMAFARRRHPLDAMCFGFRT